MLCHLRLPSARPGGQATAEYQCSRVPKFLRVPASSCEFQCSLRVPASPCEFLRVPASSCESLRVPASSCEFQCSNKRRRERKRQWPPIIKHKYPSLSFCKFANFVKLAQALSDPSDHLLISLSLIIFVVCYMDAFVVHRFTVHNVHSAYSFSSHSFGFY